MKLKITHWLAAAMCAAALLSSASALAADDIIYVPDKVFIEDFSIAPGETKLAEIKFDNPTWPFCYIDVIFRLPEGLELVPLTEDDFSPEEYTFENFNKADNNFPDDGNYMALSTNFGKEEFQTTHGKKGQERAEKAGYPFSMFMNYCGIYYDNCVGFSMMSYYGYEDDYFFNSTQPILLIKLRADERLAKESEIDFFQTIIYGDYIVAGETASSQVNGEPTVTRVRRIDAPDYDADVNGDGTVDIDDVNIVISTMLRK